MEQMPWGPFEAKAFDFAMGVFALRSEVKEAKQGGRLRKAGRCPLLGEKDCAEEPGDPES